MGVFYVILHLNMHHVTAGLSLIFMFLPRGPSVLALDRPHLIHQSALTVGMSEFPEYGLPHNWQLNTQGLFRFPFSVHIQ